MIESDQFETPPEIWEPLHKRHRFAVDLFASPANAKLAMYFCLENSALTKDWQLLFPGRWGFGNPPYSRGNLWPIMEKAKTEATAGFGSVWLVPGTPGSQWFQKNLLRGHDCVGSEHVPSFEAPALDGYEFSMVGTGYKLLIRFLSKRPYFWLNGKPTEHQAIRDAALVKFWPRCLW